MQMGLGLGRYWGDKKITERLPLVVWFFLSVGGGYSGSLSLGDLVMTAKWKKSGWSGKA